MNKRAIKYTRQGVDIYLDPNSNAYTLHKEKKWDELNNLLDLCLMKVGK